MASDVSYEALAEFAAGDMAADRARAIEEHLPQCERCRRRLEALRKADALVQALPRMEPSARASLNVRRAVSKEIRGGDAPEIMTLDEVARFLRISPDALEEIAEELPAFELGGQIRVRRARLVEWVEERERRHVRSNAESQAARVVRGIFVKGVA